MFENNNIKEILLLSWCQAERRSLLNSLWKNFKQKTSTNFTCRTDFLISFIYSKCSFSLSVIEFFFFDEKDFLSKYFELVTNNL